MLDCNQTDRKIALLGRFIAHLNSYQIAYCILRNFEDLAAARDIDILCDSKSIVRITSLFRETLSEQGWRLFSKRHSWRGVTLKATCQVAEGDGTITHAFLELDLVGFESLYLSGRQLKTAGLAKRVLIDMIDLQSISKHQFDIRTPTDEWRYLFLVNRLLYKPKPEYAEQLQKLELIPAVAAVLEKAGLSPVFTKTNGYSVDYSNAQLIDVSNTFFQTLAAGNRSKGNIYSIIRLMLMKVRGSLARKGIVITFSGPDGAGKTTMNEASARFIADTLNLQTRRLKHLYFVNSLLGRQAQNVQAKLRNIPLTEADALERDRGSGSKWRLRRMLGLLLIIGQYLPGLLVARLWTRLGDTVVVDTSFLDAFVKGHRPSFKVLENVFVRLFPLADASLLMVSAPEVIVARKPELSTVEIDEYYRRIDDLAIKSRGELKKIRTDTEMSETLASVYSAITTSLENVITR